MGLAIAIGLGPSLFWPNIVWAIAGWAHRPGLGLEQGLGLVVMAYLVCLKENTHHESLMKNHQVWVRGARPNARCRHIFFY